MTAAYHKFFDLPNNFTWNDLESAYNSKSDRVEKSKDLDDLQKHVLYDQVNRYYRLAKRDLTLREREEGSLFPWTGNQFGFRNMMWDGMDYFDRLERRINQSLNNFYEKSNNVDGSSRYISSRTRQERLLDDGSRVVLESTSENRNGTQKDTVNSYRRLEDGTIVNLPEDEAKNLLASSEKNTPQLEH